jgi:hypothetical protein
VTGVYLVVAGLLRLGFITQFRPTDGVLVVKADAPIFTQMPWPFATQFTI